MENNLYQIYATNYNYVAKSHLNKQVLREIGCDKIISVKNAKLLFDKCNGKFEKTGNPLNENQQRYTKFVRKQDLEKLIKRI